MTKRATCSAWWQSYEGEPKGWGASGSLGGGERGAGGTMLCPPWDRSRESHQAEPKRKGILCPPPPG